MTLSDIGVIIGVTLGLLQLIGICIYLGRVYEQVKTVIKSLQELKDTIEERFESVEDDHEKLDDKVFTHITNTGIHQQGRGSS